MAVASPLTNNVFDFAYNASSAANYHLSIQLNQNSFKFLLIHIAENKAIGFGNYSFDLEDKLDKYQENLLGWLTNPLFGLAFQSISIYYTSRYSTLVPSGLFVEESGNDLMKFNFRLGSNSSTNYNKLSFMDAVVLFEIPNPIKKILEQKFVKYQLKHSSSSTLNYFNEILKAETTPKVLLDVDENHFHLLVGKDSKFLLYNCFPYSNAEDFLYYMLYTLEKLELNNEETSVLICGNTTADSQEFQLLHKYFMKIAFLDKHIGLEVSLKLKEFAVPGNFKLFNQYQCE